MSKFAIVTKPVLHRTLDKVVPSARFRPFQQPIFSDRSLACVLLVWGLCWLAQVMFIQSYAVPLPWADEWKLTAVATGNEPLTLDWLWTPAQEHRAPLTRLEVLLIGRLGSWDMRVVHQVNAAFLAFGSLCLLLAARAIRGESAWCDSFLPLLVLSPGQYESVIVYGYAYAMALGLTCGAVAAAATRWFIPSIVRLLGYLALVFAIALSGGPAGNLWALGLSGVVLFVPVKEVGRLWTWFARIGASLVILISVALLLLTPAIPEGHKSFASDSVITTLKAFARLSICWMGKPLEVVWPWPLLLLSVPAVILLRHMGTGITLAWAQRTSIGLSRSAWFNLTLVLLAVVLAGLAIGYGRGRYPALFASRYQTLMIPTGVVVYLLMLQLRATTLVPQSLALWIAFCAGWNWPDALAQAQCRHVYASRFVKELRKGETPLSVLAVQHGGAVVCHEPRELLESLVQLRNQRLSAFRQGSAKEPFTLPIRSHRWEAGLGTWGEGVCAFEDSNASESKAIRAESEEGGELTYAIELPAGRYTLWGRIHCLTGTAPVLIQLDDAPPIAWQLSPNPGYAPCVLEAPLAFSAGKHELKLILPGAGTRVDQLELLTFVD